MYCGSVKVVCEYNGSIVDKKGNVIVVCEYCGVRVVSIMLGLSVWG
jgi:hypothetical protein